MRPFEELEMRMSDSFYIYMLPEIPFVHHEQIMSSERIGVYNGVKSDSYYLEYMQN